MTVENGQRRKINAGYHINVMSENSYIIYDKHFALTKIVLFYKI